MRKNTILLSIFLVFSSFSAINGQHNYIASGYYQLIYEADIAYLEGNEELAFTKLQEAERRVPLINQPIYREINLYCWLLIKNGQYDKAFYYMEKLAVEYGHFPTTVFEKIENNLYVKSRFLENNPDFFDVILPAILTKKEKFYTLERLELAQLLNEMFEEDQRVRIEAANMNFSWDVSRKINRTDSINRERMLQTVEKHGFPNECLYGSRNDSINQKVRVMFMHYSHCQEVEEVILRAVRAGKTPPSLYGVFIDRRMGMGVLVGMNFVRGKMIFGTFSNVGDDEIFDVEFIDERRLSVGMPTREQERRRLELFWQRHNDVAPVEDFEYEPTTIIIR